MTAKQLGGLFTPDGGEYVTLTDGNGNLLTVGSGTGTVTSVSVTTANGVSGTVATSTTTPAISVTLGNITPTTVQVGGSGATMSTGELGFNKISASGTAPGAGFAKMEWVAGTNANTGKLIAYAGTSTTPVTIIDNVGGGF